MLKCLIKPRILLKVIILTSTFTGAIEAHAWGERGHNMTGYLAALTTEKFITPEQKTKLGISFRSRTIQMGHLNNLPDISWKDNRRPDVVKYNNSTHFFDTELVTGLPTNGYDEAFLARVRNIEKDYSVLKAQLSGKPSPLPGVPPEKKLMSMYNDVGTAPWRVQELYDAMVTALKCAKSKESDLVKYKDPKTKPPFVSPLVASDTPKYPYYTCNATARRDEDISAALAFAGIMGHFVADMSQPFHATVDYDSWATGQGGLHGYFETFAVHMMDEALLGKIARDLDTSAKAEAIWNRVKADPAQKYFATQVILNLVADSLTALHEIQEADRKVSLVTPSTTLLLGASTKGATAAVRIPYEDSRTLRVFKPIVVARIATGAAILGRLWIEAWKSAGEPQLSDIDLITIPYLLDVPFLWPTYSQSGLD